MAAQRKRRKKKQEQQGIPEGLPALILLLVSVFVLIISIWQGDTGLIGGFLRPGLLELFGLASPLLGIWLFIFSLGLLLPGQKIDQKVSAVGLVLLQLTFQLGASAIAAGWNLDLSSREVYRAYGGLLGSTLHRLISNLVGPIGLWLILVLLCLISLSLLTRKPPLLILRLIGNTAKKGIPSPERRRKIAQQGRVVWQQTKDAAERVAETVSSLQTEEDLAAEERSRELMALATEHWQGADTGQFDVHEPVQQNAVLQVGVPVQVPEVYATEGEWWMPKKGLVPDDELILPGTGRTVLAGGSAVPARNAGNGTVAVFPGDEEIDHASLQAQAVLPLLVELEPLSEDDLPLFYENELGVEADRDSGAEPIDNGQPLQPVYLGETSNTSFPLQENVVFAPPPLVASEVPHPELPSAYQPPPLSLLAKPSAKAGLSPLALQENIEQLEQTLDMFGVKAKVIDVSQGPTLTRYELQLAPGIRVNRIANLSDDIALALAAMGVRIEAPIPGKAAIGIEVPNKETSSVMLSEILSSPIFREAVHPLTVALGKDIAGKPVVTNLADMPHLLIAGTTGSGKSVCMNSLICSILFRCSPEQVRMIMVDPKVVEMSNYNGIPHLLAPVVTDSKKAAAVLKIATQEMDRRYELFASLAVKNIGQYNAKILDDRLELATLPYWLVFIDELADLMMVAKEDVEHSITRISQLARAAGIHLVIGTQRPTTDVVTGIIKGNVPSRIAFAVSSGIDSRIILDTNGAEKLLGRGDMLFQPLGSFKPIRIQGAFISEKEVDAVVAHVKMQGVPVYNLDIVLDSDDEEEDDLPRSDRDPLFMQAAQLVVESHMGSTSYLQRRLSVGYSRAGRIMDQLQENGIVGPPKGSKPREVLISVEQLEQFR